MRLLLYLVLLLLLLVCDWADDARFEHSLFSESDSSQPVEQLEAEQVLTGSPTVAAADAVADDLRSATLSSSGMRCSTDRLKEAFLPVTGNDLCFCHMSMQW